MTLDASHSRHEVVAGVIQQSQSSYEPWPQWPAAGVDHAGVVRTTDTKVLETMGSVLLKSKGQSAQLTTAANRRLWQLVDENRPSEQWKVLDLIYWPFIGIVGWSPKSHNMLQLAVWNPVELPLEIDDSWKQILASTAAVKARSDEHLTEPY